MASGGDNGNGGGNSGGGNWNGGGTNNRNGNGGNWGGGNNGGWNNGNGGGNGGGGNWGGGNNGGGGNGNGNNGNWNSGNGGNWNNGGCSNNDNGGNNGDWRRTSVFYRQANAIGISKDLEESLKAVCQFSQRQIEIEERRETERREAEERRKHQEEERGAREEKNRVELEKKKAKEKKEADREWKLHILLAKQKEALREEFERMFDKKLRKAVVYEKAVKGKAPISFSSEEEDEDPPEDRLEKRKRQPVVLRQASPPTESPTKMGRATTSAPPTTPAQPSESPRLRAPQQQPRKDGVQLGYPYQKSSLWEGAPTAEDFSTTNAFRKAIRKFLGKKLVATIQEMCREAGVAYRGQPNAVEELIELRVMYFSIEANHQPPRVTTPTQRPRGGGIVIREVWETQPESVNRQFRTRI
ncbi:hypothetical protein CBR_g12314 [Chara braunii]|uniref:Uncharacterized protein n=1 Tax=Chara braunii TaxID=69332 RepID=A0A388KRS4_CHABU|nr:hypothetical protein CBR_g12314 [Chara braunii]|eukprot:GBG72747.1 hypothetical protein CBR_g12314 [Chara braunii]